VLHQIDIVADVVSNTKLLEEVDDLANTFLTFVIEVRCLAY